MYSYRLDFSMRSGGNYSCYRMGYLQHNHHKLLVNEYWNVMWAAPNVPSNGLPVVNKRHVQLLMPYLLLLLNGAVDFVVAAAVAAVVAVAVVVERDRLNENQWLNDVKKAFAMCYKMPVAKHIKNRIKYNYIRSKVLYFMENKCHESSTCRHKKKETLQYTLRRSQT